MNISPSYYPANGPADEEPIARPISKAVLLDTRNKLNLIRQQRTALAAEEREITKAFAENGGKKNVLRVIRMLDAMDPDDREDFLHTLDQWSTFLGFWR